MLPDFVFLTCLRTRSIGMQLTDALDELIQSGHINPVLAMRVLNEFDKAIATNLAKNVKAKSQLKVRLLPSALACSLHSADILLDAFLLHHHRVRSTSLFALDQGHLKDYRLCEEVWTFRVRNATLKLDNAEILDVDKVKIVACKMADSTTK